MDEQRAIELFEAFVHAEDAEAEARLAVPERGQHVVGNSTSAIAHLEGELIVVPKDRD